MAKDKKALQTEIIGEVFPIESNYIVKVVPNHNGHVNNTFHVIVCNEDGNEEEKYILQRINTFAFKNPDELMENIVHVTEFIRQKAIEAGTDPERETMQVIRTRDGKPYYSTKDGSCWRLYTSVKDTYCLNAVERPEQFYESARAFGHFQYLLNDFDASILHETIEKFHDTRDRYNNLENAISKDELSRVSQVLPELAFARARANDCSHLMDLQEAGVLPLRVTHNDTKLNNVLFDKTTNKVLTVIDLDTVMPGLSVNDFGDSIRFGASTASEEEKDLDKVHLDLDLFEAYTKGFMETAGQILTDAEIDNLCWGAKLMTLECGIRFLTDYLEGDIYFNIDYPEHNLDRTRTQFKLVAEIEAKWDAMQAIVAKYK